MKKSILFLLFISLSISVFSQNLKGKWINIALSGSSTYDDIILESSEGNTYFGHSRDDDSSGGFCHFKHKATFNPDTKLYLGDDVELIEKSETHVGCTFRLYYRKEGKNEYLEGVIRLKQRDGSLSGPQYVKYWKEIPPITEEELAVLDNYRTTRKAKSVANIKVEDPYIILRVLDYGKVDGDSITIFYNNQVIAHEIPIDGDVDEFEIELDKNTKTHKLYFIANNEGEVPPNTTNLVVITSTKEYEYKLFTTKKENAVITFEPNYKNIKVEKEEREMPMPAKEIISSPPPPPPPVARPSR